MREPRASSTPYWWEDFATGAVAPHDYPPARIAAARSRLGAGRGRLEVAVKEITSRSRTAEDAVRGIARWVQDALVHPPLLQPAEARGVFWPLRRSGLLSAEMAARPRVEELLRQRLVMEPELLLELGEGRCGQCVAVLGAALREAGFSAQPWQLPHHIAVEVVVDGEARVIDADAFKHGIFFDVNGRLVAKRELEANPYLVDRFKPTGWMFRRDSRYGRNARTGRRHEGYVDFYSPEEDGQLSARYNAPTVLRPPGVPRWSGGDQPRTVARGQTVDVAFACADAERAKGYRVRCGRQSRGYAYDRLVLANLHQETSCEVFDWERPEPNVSFRLTEPGRHYLTAAAIPAYADEFPSYVWWSDELIIDVS